MNCEEWSLMLEQVLLQGSSLYGSPATGAVIQPYVEDGTLGPEDPYWDDLETEDPRRCAIAQLTWHVAKDLLEEEVQPAQMEALDAIFPIAVAALLVMMGVTVVTMPIAAVYLVVRALVMIWAEGELANVLDELDTAKQDLVCAMYVGLETSYADAAAHAAVVLDAIEGLSPIDKVSLKAAFAPWAMAVAAKGWDNESGWAVTNVTPGYCDDCIEAPLVWEWDFPPDTNWRLFGTSQWYGPGWLRFWYPSGGVASSTISGLDYGSYNWKITYHTYQTGLDAISHYIQLTQKDVDENWNTPPLFVQSFPGPWVGLDWVTKEFGEGLAPLLVEHPFFTLRMVGSGESGLMIDYLKLELFPL